MKISTKIRIFFLLIFIGCDPVFRDIQFPDPKTSPYVLPFPVGETHDIFQSYNNKQGHKNRLAYDFSMPLGSPITASRGGIVIAIENNYKDSDRKPGHNNRVVIQHSDSTLAWYAHLQKGSVTVTRHDTVKIGQLLGLCGLSGRSGGVPHLHFEVFRSLLYHYGDALPVSFRNLSGLADSIGMLLRGRKYTSLPFDDELIIESELK